MQGSASVPLQPDPSFLSPPLRSGDGDMQGSLDLVVASKPDPKNGKGCACAPHTTTRTYSLPDPIPKTGEMHAHKMGGPVIKTATRPRTVNRNSRTSRPRSSRKELEYQGFRLRQVTFHGERSRLPRNSVTNSVALGVEHHPRFFFELQFARLSRAPLW